MDKIKEKLERLEEKLNQQQKKSKSALKVTVIAYAILIIFCIAYSVYVGNSLTTLATPSTVSELIIMQAEQHIPKLNNYIAKNSNQLADNLALETVNYARLMVPTVSLVVKNQLDRLTIRINSEFNSKYLPIINTYFKENKTEIIKEINNLSDEQTAEKLTSILIDRTNVELVVINNNFTNAMVKLKKQVDTLANTPNSQLTKKELAHKKALAYWMYLMDHGKTGSLVN